MANQDEEKSSPKVSRLPLPISDSPLVIDLPDGQKIVVGKMTQGSVIEVATWRGVGRPDSRTSRLMLGMGSGNVNEDSEDSNPQASGGSAPAPRKPEGFAGFVFTVKHFFTNFNRINWSETFKSLWASLTTKKVKKAKKIKPEKIAAQGQEANSEVNIETSITPSITVSPISEDADIEAWLNQITEKASRTSAKSAKPAVKKSVAKKAPAKKLNPAKKAAPAKKIAAKSSKKR